MRPPPSSRVLVVPPDAESLRLIGQHLGAWLDKRQSLLPTWRTTRLVQRQPSCTASVEQLQILCKAHNLQGYSLQHARVATSSSEAQPMTFWAPACRPTTFDFEKWRAAITDSRAIEFNTPNLLTAKRQVVFIHHQLFTPRMGRPGAGRRRDSACSQLDPENILDLPDYSRFYAEVREGLSTTRKYAKGYPTQLPVTVDEHPGRLAQGYPTLGSGHLGCR
ncbi:BZ3500_MvSof-1268-A1-R1_Chr3-3g06496 [Microbotryum saponariae]|uniref:BZ3500_MvSof-1268-A1-R1_Chr3-3g06496 protein n=1 Tax=Microbotryum saponariae TaxID=289078 RepID=A0A2X0KXZ1_9BASI|nr:BZ3500_MvSof-1268-A1-R1_Chr3-3g06496 [Microbotryum saponariae]SDA04463.1 BZ3501_MvSof-1269-A2-R1_Chr3-2g06183 [Microbotryum saponariae]